MRLHERMKEIQTDSDDKIRALAAKLGVDKHNLGNYLNGNRTVPYDVLVQFARYYNVTADYLLGLTGEPAPPVRVNAAERRLVEDFRSLSEQQKELVCRMVQVMLEQNRR